MCAFVWGHVGLKKPEVNVRCLHKVCSTLFFEAGSLTEPGVCQQAGQAGQSLCCNPSSKPHPSSHGCWNLNTGIHTSEPNVFPTKPSSQPQDDGYFYYLDNGVVSRAHHMTKLFKLYTLNTHDILVYQ